MYENKAIVGGEQNMLGARQAPPIGMALEQLEKELQSLRELMLALEQRLSPVMRPVPAMASKPVGLSSGSPLACHLDTLTELAARSSADVRDMLDCLEL